MFGIGELKDNVAALRVQDAAIIESTRKMSADIARLAKQIAELSESFSSLAQSANAAVTPHRADELAVAISKCSLDMAELDRRICTLENAQSFTIACDKHYEQSVNNGTLPRLKETDFEFSKSAVLVPNKKYKAFVKHKRTQARNRAERVLDTDADAREIRRRAKMWNIDERIITAGLAAGVIHYGRNARLSDVVVKLGYRDNAVAKYDVSIFADHKHTACYATENEQVKALTDARRFIDICRDHFNPSTVIGHA